MRQLAATMSVVVLDGGWTDVASAEHAALAVLDELGAAAVDATACTHFLRLPDEVRNAVTVATSVDVPWGTVGPGMDQAGPGDKSPLSRLAHAHLERTGGRAIRFPGQDRLVGRMAFDEVVAVSAIEGFRHTGNPPGPDAALDTRSFVRPTFEQGHLVLVTQPGLDGDAMPFEVENPTRCCEFHH